MKNSPKITLSPTQTIGTFSYYWARPANTQDVVRFAFVADLDGDGVDEVIFGGFETQPNTPDLFDHTRIQIFGWSDGKFQNLSSRWLPNGADQLEGVGDIQFGDFNGDGRTDVFIAGYADMDHKVNSYVLYNRGGWFEKHSLGKVSWQHGAAVYDINRDGIDDIVTAGWGDIPVYLGGTSGVVRAETFNHSAVGSGIALGDFLGNGSVSMIAVDWAGSNGPDEVRSFYDAYKFANNQLARKNTFTLRRGDTVKFTDRWGAVVTGTVEEVKIKNVIVRAAHTRYRVPASMLTAA